MAEATARARMLHRIVAAAQQDPRIIGVLDYGSGSKGRADEWSDLDLDIYLRDADYDAFVRDWAQWAAQFGDLLLAYIGHVGHPWTVYAATPVPLRVDFDFHRESRVEEVLTWSYSPVTVEAMVLYDGAGGKLTACVKQLVGRSLRPVDPAAAFARLCGDLWYYLLYVFSKLQRGEQWVARQAFHTEVMEHLLRLLRLEAGAVDQWRGSPAALDVEGTLAPERLARLHACVPAPGAAGLRLALSAAAELGREVCAALAARHGWPWPQELAARATLLLAPPSATGQ
ncbi:MAG: aminoglycoside 6-adenylyltransferase [Chloroflexi bacterium]|nr:aminoglycoside 6-adenylyltransferase [Chloroflexota bacterium]